MTKKPSIQLFDLGLEGLDLLLELGFPLLGPLMLGLPIVRLAPSLRELRFPRTSRARRRDGTGKHGEHFHALLVPYSESCVQLFLLSPRKPRPAIPQPRSLVTAEGTSGEALLRCNAASARAAQLRSKGKLDFEHRPRQAPHSL